MQFFSVKTVSEAEHLCKIMPDAVAVDTEYVKGNPRTTQLLSVIVADSERAWAISPSLLPIVSKAIQARKLVFLQDYNHCDTIILYANGCDLRDTNCHNLIDMHHLLDETKNHDLGSRVLEEFGDNYKKEFWTKYKSFEEASEEEALEYQCKDGIYTYRLGMLDAELFKSAVKTELYEHVRELSKALLETEINGLNVNTELIVNTEKDLKKKIDEYLPKLREEFKDAVNIWELNKWSEETSKRTSDAGKLNVKRPVFSFASDKQISWLVYDYLKIPITEETKKRNPSTSYETLKRISEEYSGLWTIVNYKETKSLYSTFVLGMLERIEDGKIYPHFNVSGTDTGRLSHSNPNMGNLPTDGVIRNFFIPSPGSVLIGADYTQLEVVIEANLTNDPNLLKIINEGVSKHDITANGLGIDRNATKTLNFALQYGAGSGKVAKILGIQKNEAESVFKRYWELYSGVHALKEETNKTIEETGQITNLAGRTRHFPKTKNKYEVFRQQRQAYNFLIQGLAAEVCNRAFYRAHQWAKEFNMGRTLFSVHDEIVMECEEHIADQVRLNLEVIMERSSEDFNFKYPLKAKGYGPLNKWTKT